MEKDAAVAAIPALIMVLIVFLIGWFFLFPQVCRFGPVQLPGGAFDWCWIAGR